MEHLSKYRKIISQHIYVSKETGSFILLKRNNKKKKKIKKNLSRLTEKREILLQVGLL